MLLSAQLACVTDRCQFKGLGLPFRAGGYMWMNVDPCPIAQFTTKIEKHRKMVTDMSVLRESTICVVHCVLLLLLL